MSPRSSRRRPSQRRRSDFARVRAGIGEVLELSVGEPAHGGACVARDASGRVVFVRHSAPGEVVRARVTAVQKNLAWADAVEIVSASADRVESVWPQAGPGGVGGGELAHLRPPLGAGVESASSLRHYGVWEASPRPFALRGEYTSHKAAGDEDPSDPLTGRRSRIDVVIDEAGRAGMHEFRGRRVIALDDMPLAVPAIRELGLFDEETPLATPMDEAGGARARGGALHGCADHRDRPGFLRRGRNAHRRRYLALGRAHPAQHLRS